MTASSTERRVIPFPTKRKRGYKQPAGVGWWKNPEFAEIPRLHKTVRDLPPADPISPTAFLVLAMWEALRTDPQTWERTGGPDAFGQLVEMLHRFEDDPEVSVNIGKAFRLLYARNAGRWHG